jgi:hypothetical protein
MFATRKHNPGIICFYPFYGVARPDKLGHGIGSILVAHITTSGDHAPAGLPANVAVFRHITHAGSPCLNYNWNLFLTPPFSVHRSPPNTRFMSSLLFIENRIK